MRQFGDAARAAADQDQNTEPAIEVLVLDREIFVEYPGSGSIAYLTAAMAVSEGPVQTVAAVLNFFTSLLEDEDGRFIQRKILDPKSGFDAEDLAELLEYLIEEWSGGNPTSGPSASSRRPATSGSSSTATQRRSASSRSRSRTAASSTGSTPAS